MGHLRKIWAVVVKDIALECRTWEMISAMLIFSVLAVFAFSFALDLRGASARGAVPGILWTTVAFAGTLGLNRSFAREQQSGCIDGLLLVPGGRAAIFLGKALGNVAMMLIMETFLLILLSGLFSVPLLRPNVLGVVALGTAGYAAAGTLLAAVAVNTRAREVMLPVLLLPLAFPLLIAAVQATGGLIDGKTLAEVSGWVRLLIAYDVGMAAIATLTFEHAVGA
ncbi:MAG: heme exporter protein CcmB [Anaerolineae bacterium]|nr:heme exporter protein CcmB [Anaerolineae bacterium]